MAGARIWIVDAEHWPRAYLRAELIERGFDAVGFVAVDDALAALALGRPRPRLAVVDLRGQPSDPRRLAPLLRFGFPVVAVGGAAEWAAARHHPWAAFLRRPLTIGAVADEVERRLAAAPGGG
ncbi:MAG TPA: hypothetical protein VHO06_05320 [Polyangia bacterium]|nr:hypothetical protein [Polyangia bacterium]